MNGGNKNRLLTWLLLLLLIINAATIVLFWIGRTRQHPGGKGSPKDFLIKELKLDDKQWAQFEDLARAHRAAVEPLRQKVREAKDRLFDLVKETNASDSTKQEAAAAVSKLTEQIDILTLNHFQQVRAICNADQQVKFDKIIHEITSMMAPRPGGPPPGPGGDRPPPPGD